MDGDPLMETRILEASLAKICSLLAVGFGDAGAEVIGDNIKSGGDLNPMIPGHKVIGIYGFCDIRQFTDATEVLQVRALPYAIPPPPPTPSPPPPPISPRPYSPVLQLHPLACRIVQGLSSYCFTESSLRLYFKGRETAGVGTI